MTTVKYGSKRLEMMHTGKEYQITPEPEVDVWEHTKDSKEFADYIGKKVARILYPQKAWEDFILGNSPNEQS